MRLSELLRRRLSGPGRPAAAGAAVALCAGAALALPSAPAEAQTRGREAPSVPGAASPAPVRSVQAAPAPVEVERETLAMGTRLRIRAGAADRAAGIRAIGAAFDEVARIEEALSTWREDSELARLNRAPAGEPVPADPEVLGLLAEARRWARATGGAFEPAVGALVDAWDLRGEGRVPAAAELGRALRATGPAAVELDPEAGTLTRRDPRAWIDAGGFGKGAALRAAREALGRKGATRALLDFGGQVLAMGGGWTVAVAHPERRGEASGVRLALEDVSAATTSASERRVVAGGDTLGHVLDPRTGRPVRHRGSVTVVARDPLAADALSTGLFVTGPEEALRRARDLRDVGVLVLERTKDGAPRARWNDAMERWLETAPRDPSRTNRTIEPKDANRTHGTKGIHR